MVVLFGIVPYTLRLYIEQIHIVDEIQQLVEANMLVSQLLTLLLACYAASFDIPDIDGCLFLFDFDSGLLVDGLEEG